MATALSFSLDKITSQKTNIYSIEIIEDKAEQHQKFEKAVATLMNYRIYPPSIMRAYICTPDKKITLGATIIQRNGIEFGFWFAPSGFRAVTPKPACPPNGPRVYEPARRAQAVALLPLSNRRDHRAGWASAPSDRRERRVNPLLYEVVAHIFLPALPRMARPCANQDFWPSIKG